MSIQCNRFLNDAERELDGKKVVVCFEWIGCPSDWVIEKFHGLSGFSEVMGIFLKYCGIPNRKPFTVLGNFKIQAASLKNNYLEKFLIKIVMFP